MVEFMNDMDHVMFTEEQIQAKVDEMADMLTKEYDGKCPIMVCILKGSVMFYADLCKRLKLDMQMDFMVVSAYKNGTEPTGNLEIKKDLSNDIKGRDVIIVEDIIDTGFTLSNLKAELLKRSPASLKIITLLDKPDRRRDGVTVKSDYSGFVIANEFVVGYGLDFAEKYRNLPYIGVLKPEIYTEVLKDAK